MKSETFINSYCHIKNNSVLLNGTEVYKGEKEASFSGFIKSAYKSLDTNYSKFFKMDNLSKLAFLGADVLLKHENVDPEKEEDIALVFSNNASSLDTDRKYQKSIEDDDNFYPSPAVFVYTLPNICLGEISIKHKLYSENSFFIFENFNPEYLHAYSTGLIQENKAEKVLCGWVNIDKEDYTAFLYLISKEQGLAPHTIKEVKSIF
ncbi:3-oxoacyl-ACP synthase [uncultured Maribacter sp.]|uniref:3-oxoacyl-ACP synthase n=1 Tax=uncultured Maribacter sp. TaxID=431308 RepID=UPI00262EE619|nr:3-oxoacyl-ACP synthase [uncultured Maribacter sp.]